MSEIDTGFDENLSSEALNKLAVGVVASGDDIDAVARVILRAHSRGHHVLVMYFGPSDLENSDFLDGFGTTVLTPETDDLSRSSRQVLQTAARHMGFPGLMFHANPSEYIDYSRTVTAQTEEYVVETTTRLRPSRRTTPTVLVAIPAYNEEDTIDTVVSDAEQYADTVVVVDDGSDDNTASKARAAGAVVIEHGENRGYGRALKTAFQHAAATGTDYLVVIDADGQHDASDIPKLISKQRETGAEIVVGSRFADGAKKQMPFYRLIGLQVVNLLTNLSLGFIRGPIKDTQSGFRVYDEQSVRTLANDNAISDHMGASTDILYHAKKHGYDVEEVGTDIRYDINDESSRNPIAHGLQLVANILRIVEYDRPISAFGVPGFVSVLVGVGLGYWTIHTYLQTAEFSLASATASVFFTMIGVFACFTSIILHSIDQRLDDSSYN